MTALHSSLSLRHAALAVTTITVAFAAGDATHRDCETPPNDAGLTAADLPLNFAAAAQGDSDPAGVVFEPYADPSARRSWVPVVDPLSPALEARAQGYVVQVGAFATPDGAHRRGDLFASGRTQFAMSTQRVEGAQLGLTPAAGARIVLG